MEKLTDYREPVTAADNFIGRDTFISKIYARIGAGRPQSVSIVGDYKIGKTSLINILTAEKTKQSFLKNPAEYIYITLAINESITDTSAFADFLASELIKKTRQDLDKTITFYDWFKKTAEQFTSDNQKIIFFLDDFNLITQNEKFPLEFFSFLRSMANNYNVAYVTTSYHDLQKLCVSKDVEESPFFNIFTNITLRALSKDEAKQLLSRLHPSVTDSEKELLYKYCGGFPYQLKVALEVLKKLSPFSEDEFKNDLYAELQTYYENLFSRFDTSYKRIFKSLAAGYKIHDQIQFLLADLERRDYVYKSDEGPQIYSEIFERFINEKFQSKKRKSKKSFLKRLIRLFRVK
jgi:serine/threonine-protein kinase